MLPKNIVANVADELKRKEDQDELDIIKYQDPPVEPLLDVENE